MKRNGKNQLFQANDRLNSNEIVFNLSNLTRRYTFFFMASDQRIADVTNHAITLRRMINDTTFGIQSTNWVTWIFAFVIQTGVMAWTITVCDTLWSTSTVWIAEIVWQAFTCASTTSFYTNCVRATRICCTRMFISLRCDCLEIFQF